MVQSECLQGIVGWSLAKHRYFDKVEEAWDNFYAKTSDYNEGKLNLLVLEVPVVQHLEFTKGGRRFGMARQGITLCELRRTE